MAKTILSDRRTQARPHAERWQSALTEIPPDKILIRCYPLDEMMGPLGLAGGRYLVVRGVAGRARRADTRLRARAGCEARPLRPAAAGERGRRDCGDQRRSRLRVRARQRDLPDLAPAGAHRARARGADAAGADAADRSEG